MIEQYLFFFFLKLNEIYTFKNWIEYLYKNKEYIPQNCDRNVSYFKECNNKWDLTIGGDAYGIDCISNQWNPMHSWIPDDIDKIYYFEHIETILDDISNRLQLDLSP